MKNNKIKTILSLAILIALIIPAQAFAAENNSFGFDSFLSQFFNRYENTDIGYEETNNAEPETPSVTSSNIGSYEQQVLELVNKERAAVGLPGLKMNADLAAVAEKKAEDMRDNNYFSHTSPTYGSPFDMMKQFGISYKAAGENIAKGQRTPEEVMNGWMNSKGHRENILNANFTEIGVGFVTDSNGGTYWVQMFIRP
ncbi:MAG: serine protease [Clostridiales bacterium]|nr:serine protease [Clostridiales bacterium]